MIYQSRFIDNSQEVLDELHKRIDKALEEAGLFLESEAKKFIQKSPMRVDTGLLRNSITHAISGEAPATNAYYGDKESKYKKPGSGIPAGTYSGTAPNDPDNKKAVYIGTNVKYAIYVHEGTSRLQPPNRFLRNAVEANQEQAKKKIQEILKQDISF